MFNLDMIASKEREAEFADNMRGNKDMDPVTKGKNGFIWLADLAVDPRFQRKGIGKKLLAWGFEKADAEDLPIGQWASVEGNRLYRQVGFVEVGVYEVANVRGTGFIRWPQGKRPEAAVEESLS
jgi:GNAT superfamily N-acetyltransferase